MQDGASNREATVDGVNHTIKTRLVLDSNEKSIEYKISIYTR